MSRFTRRAALLAPLALASAAAGAQLRRITIGSNPAGTNFHVVAGGFARALQESLGTPAIVRPYSGSSVYMPLLQRGEITLGVNSGIDSWLAYEGLAPYPSPMRNLRGLTGIYPLGYMYWTRASDRLDRVEELRGRRVVTNYRGLPFLDRLNQAILESAGLGEGDYTAVTAAGLPEGARALVEGRADAVATGYRLPLVSQMHASVPGGIRFLSMGENEAVLAQQLPGTWVQTVVPEPATVGIDGPRRVAFYQTYLNTGTHLADDDAYAIVAALHERWPTLRTSYAVLSAVEPDGLLPATNPHPFHAGAVRYFEEAGLWTAGHDAARRSLLAA